MKRQNPSTSSRTRTPGDGTRTTCDRPSSTAADALMRRRWVPIATVALGLSLLIILPARILGSCGSPRSDTLHFVSLVSALVLSLACLGGIVATSRGISPKRLPLLWSVFACTMSLFIVLMPAVPLLGGIGLC